MYSRSPASPALILGLVLALTTAMRSSPAWAAQDAAADREMVLLPAGELRPAFRRPTDPEVIPVPAFRLDVRPVSNADFLEFVRSETRWQRSQVKRLFADPTYLAHWKADLDPGSPEVLAQPVIRVSWFAAKAYAAWRGVRLPSTDEWERAAAVGFTQRDGRTDPVFVRASLRWYSSPAPVSLPPAGSRPPNLDGVRDLHGPVWEWTSDFNSALVTGDSRGDTGLERQLFCAAGALGASDPSDFTAYLRYGFRSSLRAAYTLPHLGFRCAATP